MATPVIQLVPTDPSLQNNPDFNSMTEYLISGTYYIVDNSAQVIYEFANNTPGNPIVATGGSYAQFIAFLAANPPVIQTNTATYPAVVSPQQEYIYLLRGILVACMQMATSGNQSVPTDFYPLASVL